MKQLNRQLYGHGNRSSRRRFSTARRKQLRENCAAKTDARVRAAMDEIMAAYEPGWPLVPKNKLTGKKTWTAIARWLVRTERVKSFKYDASVLEVLKILARRRKIKLPRKTVFGGARKKK